MRDAGRTLKEFINAARDLLKAFINAALDLRNSILLVFYQHPAWFTSLKTIETCGLLLNKCSLIKSININKIT